jgi:hypothetical protein
MARWPLPLIAPARGCDCRVCPFFVGNPAAAEPICSGCNTDCSYCGCARAGGGPGCRQCPVRCGSRVDIGAWMADVGGTLAFDDVVVGLELPAGLPVFIPQVDGGELESLDAQLAWPAYAIGLRRVVSPKTLEPYPRFAGTAAEGMGLRPGQLAVLVGYGLDPLVEALWTRKASLLPRLAAQRWDLVLAPNYSMYGSQPRTEHLINFRRNLLIAAELEALGVPAVANIYWFRREDLDRYLAWMADVAPPAIGINLQTFRTDAEWEAMALPGLTYLSLGLPERTKVVVTGTSRAGRIATLGALFPGKLVLVSQNPLQYARHGAQMTDAGRVDRPARVEDLFTANVWHYAQLVARAGGAEP